MIITRTPLRISLVGGGTDFPSFYSRFGGAVVSFAINKYVYITVSEKYDGRTKVSYAHTELVDDPAELQHDLVRETLRFFGEKGLEITSVADVPGYGTGLGSSSAFEVGLINALCSRTGGHYPNKMLAEVAYTVEAILCGHSVGKQDQYAAAYGGVHFYEFEKDHIRVEPLCLSAAQREYLENHLLLFHVDRFRNSEAILEGQECNLRNSERIMKVATQMRDLAQGLRKEFLSADESLFFLGKYLHENWMLKKQLQSEIADKYINGFYATAIRAGAIGGKMCGAGGGGFMLFFAEPDRHEAIREALGLRQMLFKIEPEGSKVIYDSRNQV